MLKTSSKIDDNDVRAKQSLELFKNWLVKHRYIKYTGEDNIDNLLLVWLRVKKFSMQKAYESFEYTIPHMKSHPEWYSNPCAADYDFTDKPNSPLIFLKKTDADGRRIYIYKMKNFESFDSCDFIRKNFLTPLLYFFDINAQLNGVVVILDYRDVNLGKLKNLSIQFAYDAFKLSKLTLVRPQQINFIGMPSILKPILDISKSFTSAKIIQRFNFLNDVKELSKYMDVSLLPEEYGGSSNEFQDYEAFELGVAYVKKILNFDVDFSKIQNEEFAGSFRKLEID